MKRQTTTQPNEITHIKTQTQYKQTKNKLKIKQTKQHITRHTQRHTTNDKTKINKKCKRFARHTERETNKK